MCAATRIDLILSLREWPAKRVFELKDKLAEFRTTWPWNFEGRVHVYGSGPKGVRAVIGSFKPGKAVFIHPTAELPDEALDWLIAMEDEGRDQLQAIDDLLAEQECAKETGRGFWLIPITDVVKFPHPVPLRSYKGRDGRPIERPPQSWIFVTANAAKE